MDKRTNDHSANDLVGVGLYTPKEASRLLRVPAAKITRWLRGHDVKGKWYDRLWRPQVDIGDGKIYLGFRDLMEMRTAHAFMESGVSAVMIRRAIQEARIHVDDERPLSTKKFMTDGRSIFLEIADESGDNKLLDLFKKQYAFKRIIEASLRGVEFDGIVPARWWPDSMAQQIVVDPDRSFGQPIDYVSGVPTAVLAAAAKTEGGIKAAAKLWQVSEHSVKRAVKFEIELLEAA